MIGKGLNIEIKDKFEETPLHHACSRGRVKTVQFLLSKGVNINSQNRFGETPLHKACALGNYMVS